MDDTIKKGIRDQFKSLPKSYRDAIVSLRLTEKVKAIANTYQLNEDQAIDLENEVYLVLINLEDVSGLIDALVTTIKVAEATAVDIMNDINENIFQVISTMVKNDHVPIKITNVSQPISMPNKENILAGIETPEGITENKISVSTLQSNKNVSTPLVSATKSADTIPDNEKIEIRPEITPEIKPVQNINKFESLKPAQNPIAKNPMNNFPKNIMEAKLKGETIVPKQESTAEDASKLPKKTDPYRENF